MFLYVLFFLGGFAALSWELLWQIKSSLALGSSAWGTAVILSITMGGMCMGSLFMGTALKNRDIKKSLRLYGFLEILIGLHGLLLTHLFTYIEQLDGFIYDAYPDYVKLANVLGITFGLLFPAMCMGATIPVLGLIARQYKTSISLLYGLNTLGAAFGVLLTALLVIPLLALSGTIYAIASVNILIGLICWVMASNQNDQIPQHVERQLSGMLSYGVPASLFIVFITGFSTFMLEISWFRLITASFHSTTDAFAIMLAVFLLALGCAGASAKILKFTKKDLSVLICIAGILALLATPIIERFDYVLGTRLKDSTTVIFYWFISTLYVVGIPVFFLGLALPWILGEQDSPRRWSQLYSLNTFGAILGAICAAWFFLPWIGAVKTALLAGILVCSAGFLLMPKSKKLLYGTISILALGLALFLQSGVGTKRVQGLLFSIADFKVLKSFDGPDATTTVIEYPKGGRGLVIDGFLAADQKNKNKDIVSVENYMAWMGHLPMLLHPAPKHALVICMGTGQTLNGIRKENPETIDIVDINPKVFKLAHYFTANENVLEDSRVTKTVMDGRAYIRRTDKKYDVITLEPMPPSFAGVNALYSLEFYLTASQKMSDKGIIAQWIPFHLMAPHYADSIVRTFITVFPNSLLWLDPLSKTGILVGSKDLDTPLGSAWPGFARTKILRNLDQDTVLSAVFFNSDDLIEMAKDGEIVNDNNQLLAYGEAVFLLHSKIDWQKENLAILEALKRELKQ